MTRGGTLALHEPLHGETNQCNTKLTYQFYFSRQNAAAEPELSMKFQVSRIQKQARCAMKTHIAGPGPSPWRSPLVTWRSPDRARQVKPQSVGACQPVSARGLGLSPTLPPDPPDPGSTSAGVDAGLRYSPRACRSPGRSDLKTRQTRELGLVEITAFVAISCDFAAATSILPVDTPTRLSLSCASLYAGSKRTCQHVKGSRS